MSIVTEQKKIKSIAEELNRKNHRVIVQPHSNDLPFHLGSYQPDILAFNDKGGLIIEVKSQSNQISADRLQEVSEIVSRHPNWRFLLVTPDDQQELDLVSYEKDLPSWTTLQDKLREIQPFLQNSSMLEPALVYLWGLTEVALRKRAIIQFLPVERFSMTKLVKHMYSSGEISFGDFDLIESLMEKRNRAAHGLTVPLKKEEIESLFQTVHHLVTQWSSDKTL